MVLCVTAWDISRPSETPPNGRVVQATWVDKDATIRLTQQCTEGGGGEHTPLELPPSWDSYLKEIAPEENQGLFTVVTKDSRVYVQENHRVAAQVLANCSGTGISRLDARIYRHPERQGQPSTPFKKIHDIYSLGVVLLEIGLWEPAIKLQRNLFAHAIDSTAVRAQLVKHAQRRLESRVGRRFKEVVLKCLNGDFGVDDDTREDMKLQQAFRHQVLDVIEQAANSV